MRPSGPLPWTVARFTPSSAARRFARGEALTSALGAAAPLPSWVAGAAGAARSALAFLGFGAPPFGATFFGRGLWPRNPPPAPPRALVGPLFYPPPPPPR